MYVTLPAVEIGAHLDTASPVDAFVAAFAGAWRAPSGPDAFADHLEQWFATDVRLIQPQMPPIVGVDAFREDFVRPLFALMPDLHGIVEGWAASGDVIYIDLRLEGTVGRRRVTMRSVDRITLRDGRMIERVANLDPTPLVTAVLLSPSAWLRFARTQLRALRRRRT
jgi:SnoaL-like domain